MAGKKDIVEQALKLIAGSSDDVAKRIASIRRSEPFPADYIEPGSVRYRYDHPDTSSFMEIVTRPKGARSASVIGLEVPEEYRGTGIGKALQERVLQDYPSLMGQVSSKAAAVNAYKAGRRPLANPNATLEDVFKMIDEDSSVNLATEKNIGGSIREGYGPGGWVDDVVKMAGKVISGEGDDAAKAGIRAYQGSPHNFAAERLVRFPEGRTEYLVGQPDVLPDVPEGAEVIQDFPLGRMRMDKIGTGEGAQAYGHGLYFAENEGIARSYRDALSPKKVAIGGQMVDSPTFFKAARRSPSVDDNIAMLTKQRENILKEQAQYTSDPELGDFVSELYDQQLKDVDKELSELSQYKGQWFGTRPGGSMYEININADPNAFLDWDKPLSEQPSLTRALGNYNPEYYVDYDEIIHKAMQSLQPVREPTGEDIYRALGHPKTATRMLNTMGVPGIRFLDAGSRVHDDTAIGMIKNYGSREKALEVAQKRLASAHHSDRASWQKTVDALSRPETRNLVVFDDKLISIIRKYGIAGASAMLGYNLMEQLDPKQALAASMADQDYQASRPQRSMGGNNSISGALNVARGLNGVE